MRLCEVGIGCDGLRMIWRTIVCCGFLSASALAGEGEWTEFRGPTGQGLAEAGPSAWGVKKGVVWKTPLPGKGWSSPVMSGGRIALTAAKLVDGKTVLAVMAVDAESGKVLWEKDVFRPTAGEVAKCHAKNSLASATPVIVGETLYVHFGHMGTAAMELASGTVIWKRDLEYDPMHGSGSSPVVVDGKLVFHMDGDDQAAIRALDAKTGKDAWMTPRNEDVKRSFSFCTPLLVNIDGRRQLVSVASGMVGGYAPEDGTLLWKVRFDEGFSVIPRPVTADGMVYVATGFMKPKLLGIKLGGAKGDVTQSHVAWEVEKNMPKTPSVVAKDGVVYVLADNGMVSCLNGKSGEVRWQEKLLGNFSASPLLAGETLYCMTEDGACYVLKVSPQSGKVVFEIEMEERIFASPMVVDGMLYLRTEEALWKIGAS